MNSRDLAIYTDGGSRGNPGFAACAFVALEGEKTVYSESKFLGKTTNNIAEYNGVLIALEWLVNDFLLSNEVLTVTFFLDSELVVKQINGLYKVKDQNIKMLFSQITSLINKTNKKIIFKNIPREKNKKADMLVNKRLDLSLGYLS